MSFMNNFEQTLQDFFFRYHPRQSKKIPQIISEFKGQEKEVMLLLCKKYKVDPSTIDGLNSYTAPVVEATPAIEETVESASEEVTSEVAEQEVTEQEETTEVVEDKKAEKKKKK